MRFRTLATPRRNFFCLRLELRDGADEIVESLTGRGNRAHDHGAPLAIPVCVQRKQRLHFGCRSIGAVAIGLVDDEDVGDFHDASLERLHIVAHTGYEDDDRHVGYARNLDLVLAHTDGFDGDEIFAGSVEHDRRIRRGTREAAKMAACGHTANKDAGIVRMRLHPNAIPEHGAATERARRIDREDANSAPGFPPARHEAVDKRALACARCTRDPDEESSAGPREKLAHQCGSLVWVIFDERNTARDATRIAGQYRICECGQPAEFITEGPSRYNAGTMRMRRAVLALVLIAVTPTIAHADVTAFLGRNSAGDNRAVTRGFAFGVSLLVVGFEFEYANSNEDLTDATPSLRTTSGNVFVQTFGLPVVQLYATTGGGFYREKLANDQETAFLLNNGGGIKITIAGPIRARVDYRVFTLKGNPRHATVQRLYAGVNVAF